MEPVVSLKFTECLNISFLMFYKNHHTILTRSIYYIFVVQYYKLSIN